MIFAPLALLWVSATLPPPQYEAQFHDAERLLETVTVLSTDEMRGRRTSSDQSAMARAIIKQRFTDIGLASMGDDGGYEHAFTWKSRRLGKNFGVENSGINLISWLPGDPKYAGQKVMVISAHYDHIGVRDDGEVYNGADDNASGVAALLEVAAYFKDAPHTHDILFIALDAEEMGLQGAKAFVANPPIAIGRIALNLNLDMVARADKGELFAVGAHRFPFLEPYIKEVAKTAPLALLIGHDGSAGNGEDWTFMSDQGAFVRAKIPAIYLGVEDHADYHKTSDTADKIDPIAYAKSADTIIMMAQVLENNLTDIALQTKDAAAAQSE